MKNRDPKLSICVPAYNEEKTIKQVLEKLLSLKYEGRNFVSEVIVGDDRSKDETFKIASQMAEKDFRIKVIRHEKNLGKTQNVKRCILQTTGEVVAIQDADLESDPEDLKKMYKAYIEGDEKILYGNRFHNGAGDLGPNYWGNRILTLISNIFTGFRGFYVCDMEVNYKMADGDLFREIVQTVESESCFGFEPEVTAKFARSGYKVKNIDISYEPRTKEEGKHMNALRDGLKAFCEIIKYNIFYRGYKGYSPESNDQQKRLLLSTHRAYPVTGGLERHVYKVGQEISKDKNFEVLNLAFNQTGKEKRKYSSNFTITGLKSFHIFGNAYPLPTPLQMLRYYIEIGRFNPDVVHTHGRHFASTWLAIIWAWSHGREIIHTEHGGEIYFTNSTIARLIKALDKTFIRLMLSRTKVVTAVSESVAHYLHEELKIKNIQLVHNFIDPVDLKISDQPVNKKLLKVLKSGKKIVAFPYRLVDSKGYKYFIELAERYIENDKYLFVAAGDGPGEVELIKAEKSLKNLVFLGTLDHSDSLQLIKNAEIVTNFSAQEGLPTTLMEAMWFKRKLLITDLGPNLEVTSKYLNKTVCKRESTSIQKYFEDILKLDFRGSSEMPLSLLLTSCVNDYKTLYLRENLNKHIQFTLSELD